MIRDQYLICKVVIVGDCGVGKSSLLERVCDDQFSQNYRATLGVDFKYKTFPIDGKQVKLQLWDTAGQERFRNITSAYYRGALGIIIVYDVSDEVSFKNIEFWTKQIENHASSDVLFMMIGNKIDKETRQVSTETAQAYAESKQMEFFEVSAKTSDSVSQAFLSFTRRIINTKEANNPIKIAEQTFNQQESQNQTLKKINLEANKEKDSCC